MGSRPYLVCIVSMLRLRVELSGFIKLAIVLRLRTA